MKVLYSGSRDELNAKLQERDELLETALDLLVRNVTPHDKQIHDEIVEWSARVCPLLNKK